MYAVVVQIREGFLQSMPKIIFQGQEETARKMITECRAQGHWMMLQVIEILF